MRGIRRPPLLQRHTGVHVTPLAEPQAWPTDLDIAVADRAVRRFILLDPVGPWQPVSFTQLVLLYNQQHDAAAVFKAAYARVMAR